MKRVLPPLLTAAAFAWFVSVLTAAAPLQQPAAQQPAASAETDPAHELFIATCNRCHDAARITALRRTKTEWEEVINKMIERGATGSEEDFLTVFGFLRRHYGKVYINSASSDEITTSLGLSSKDAEAVITYRKAHGNFADLEAVKKVPDIDVKVLDEHKEAVAF
ncbi:MAG TPA: helix-hairpin-helix domain-containing protein [Beijerinckiaceae bacterium]|nr:helix-hairpin-helix domain-containing protein [Beijerinckiaceae bacterium]